MSELVSQVKDEQSYIVVRERTHRNTAESTNSRIKWWSIFQLMVLIGQGFFQVWWLKRFFEVSHGGLHTPLEAWNTNAQVSGQARRVSFRYKSFFFRKSCDSPSARFGNLFCIPCILLIWRFSAHDGDHPGKRRSLEVALLHARAPNRGATISTLSQRSHGHVIAAAC